MEFVRYKQLREFKSKLILWVVVVFLFCWEKAANFFFTCHPRQLILPATMFQFFVLLIAMRFETPSTAITVGVIGNLVIVGMVMLPGMFRPSQEG